MGFNSYDFLDRMCSRVKYKAIHRELWEEVKSHAEDAAEQYECMGYDKSSALEMAFSNMGSAEEIGDAFNKVYRLPFNCKFGFTIWAAIVTVLIYLGYPLIYKLNNGTINVFGHNLVAIFCIFALFAIINILYLRRSPMVISIRDMAYIALGFLIGWAVSFMGLVISSVAFLDFEALGYYPYFQDVPMLFAPPFLPLLPKNLNVFGIEYLSLWACLMLYMAAVKSRKKIKPFTLVAGYFRISDGVPMENSDVLVENRDERGNRIRLVALDIMGKTVNKYGEIEKRWRKNERDY